MSMCDVRKEHTDHALKLLEQRDEARNELAKLEASIERLALAWGGSVGADMRFLLRKTS